MKVALISKQGYYVLQLALVELTIQLSLLGEGWEAKSKVPTEVELESGACSMLHDVRENHDLK